MFYEVIPEGKVEALTYHYDGGGDNGDDNSDSLFPGQIVTVPVGRRIVPGVVTKKVAQPDFKTKAIIKKLYSRPLPKHLLDTVRFIHEYYLAPSGSALSLVLPRGVEKKRRKTEQMFGSSLLGAGDSHASSRGASKTPVATGVLALPLALPGSEPPSMKRGSHLPTTAKTEHGSVSPEIRLNEAQKKALKGLQKAPGATKLLFGVTGSGKTNIYLKMAKNALERHLSTVLLVPEIALTGQLVRVFNERFGERVIMIHSRLTEAERHLIFEKILMTDESLIVVGARSALFAPVAHLGLIIIDEEHEGTYYQENTPKYSAIRVGSFIAKASGASLVLGSATPTVEDYYLASRQESVVTLTKKAKSSAIKPAISIIDFKDRDNFTRNKYFSNSLLTAISANLNQGQQTLIFHNRRGSAPLTICENCGEEILCPNCFLPLTLHADEYVLHCHTCGFSENVPAACPKCGTPNLVHKGFGTKLLESELCKLFPGARIRRFDADNKKGEGMDALYSAVRDGEVDILVGTQTLAKGLDLPRLATVGVVQADAGLALPDYMAEERCFQLLTQVIGRVGRGHLAKAEVFIQTFRPEHPVLKLAADEDYLGFYKYLIAKRRRAGFPPFRFVMKLEITMKTEAIVLRKVRELVKRLTKDERLMISPPQPGFHERTAKGYTWQIIVRSRSRKALLEACEGLDQSFKITLDPMGLL
ncbi:primosomal protein N' [Candidatus Saccharibacteria bacterium]|nr:primosomal protein N' [Candidatus Saccharibacteria bacterium]